MLWELKNMRNPNNLQTSKSQYLKFFVGGSNNIYRNLNWLNYFCTKADTNQLSINHNETCMHKLVFHFQ